MRYLKVADIATGLSLVSSILAFYFAAHQEFVYAALLLVASVIFDGLDGRIARAMGQASDFGMYLDSLTDIIAFGVVPAFIAFNMFLTPAVIIAATVYLAAGIYRLARFQTTRLKGKFEGMPITLNGIFFAAVLFAPRKEVVFPLYFIISAVLMVSTFRVKKL